MRGSHRLLIAPLGALLVAASACDGLDPRIPLLELGRNRELWESVRPTDYRYAVERTCFCGPPALGPARVTVEGDVVTERVYVDSGESVPAAFEDGFPTVDGLFDVILDAFEREAHRLEVTYDATSGVPLEIDIDYQEFVDDEELGLRVTEEVTPLS